MHYDNVKDLDRYWKRLVEAVQLAQRQEVESALAEVGDDFVPMSDEEIERVVAKLVGQKPSASS